MVHHKGNIMYQIICEEKQCFGFGIECYTFRFASSMLYTHEEGTKEIEKMKDWVTFKNCRFHLNKVDVTKVNR